VTCGSQCMSRVGHSVCHVWVTVYVTCGSQCMSCVGHSVCHVWVTVYVTCGSQCMSRVGDSVCHVWVTVYVTCGSQCMSRNCLLVFQENFTQDMQPHYIYSPREMTRFKPLESLSVEGLVRIWAHEALRLFQDRYCELPSSPLLDRCVDFCIEW